MRTRITTPAVLIAATAALLAASPSHAAPPIRVVVNGMPLQFTGTPPMQVAGSTLVPMRGIFEALGATVKFDKATQTVFGQKGETAIILPVGAHTASVNGQATPLAQPAQLINGTTLVPLRFIAESLGATAVWDPTTSTVLIQSVDQHVASLPAPPAGGNVSGQVTGVYTNTTPTQLTLMVGGKNTVVPLSAATIVLRSATGQAATQVPLSQIKPGDQVTVERGDNGVATVVTATFGEVRGTIVGMGKLADGNTAITLDSGKVIEVAPDAPVTFGGRSVALSDVKTYEKVVIRTNPANDMGYGVAVATAATPNPTPPGDAPGPVNPLPPGTTSVSVTSFTDNVTKPLKAGETLSATLSGTPGGKASFAIPGVTDNVPMTETSPGVYEGTYTVPRGVSIAHAAVLGKLTFAGATSPLVQAPGTVTVAGQPPKVTDFGPAKGATVESARPLIYAQFSSPSVGVNPDETRLTLDGQAVTPDAVTPSLLTYKPLPSLASGPHAVSLSVTDKAGNATTLEWNFTVSTSKLVQAFTTNEPSGRAVGAGQTVVLTLTGQPGGTATASIGTLAKDIPLRETDPGVYVGEYTIKAGDSVENAPVTARFTTRDGTAVTSGLTGGQAGGLTVAAGPPPAPKILSPTADDTVDASRPLEVKGRAQPGSTVRVTVNYVSKVLGGFLPVSGSSGSQDVVANKNGDWSATGLSLKTNSLFGAGRDTVFTITATQLDAGGNAASKDASVQVRPQ